jgi:hypothetical protein
LYLRIAIGTRGNTFGASGDILEGVIGTRVVTNATIEIIISNARGARVVLTSCACVARGYTGKTGEGIIVV